MACNTARDPTFGRDDEDMALSKLAPHRDQFLKRLETSWSKARPHYRAELAAKVGALYDRFMDEHLADPEFAKQIALGDSSTHVQRMGELLLAGQLWDWGFRLSSQSEGPDFRATKGGQSVWIELITPTDAGIPRKQPAYPHVDIALRYTAGIKEKHEKLVGRPCGKPGYLANGIVAANEPYVIAFNQHLLLSVPRTLGGISQRPTAVEVLFAVGPIQLHIDRETRKVVGRDNAYRPQLLKKTDVKVPADSFLHSAYAPVSAVLALDLVLEKFITTDPDHYLLRDNLSAMVYNPNANNPSHRTGYRRRSTGLLKRTRRRSPPAACSNGARRCTLAMPSSPQVLSLPTQPQRPADHVVRSHRLSWAKLSKGRLVALLAKTPEKSCFLQTMLRNFPGNFPENANLFAPSARDFFSDQ